MIARFNPASIKKKPRYMVQNLVPDSDSTKKAASAAAIVAGVPAAREVALKNLGSGAEAAYPMQPDVYGGQDTDASSPGPTQITDPNAPQNIPSQRESTPEVGIERQAVIANQKRGARYDPDSIMGFVSSLVGNPKANEAFDPTKPIGGANVPYQEAKGLQRFFGNQANMLNLGAQQAQGAKWEAEADEQQKEDRLIKRMQEADKPQALRFDRQLAENKAIREEEQKTRKAEREQDRLDRLAQIAADQNRWRQERLDKVTQLQAENDLRSKPRFGAISTGKGGAIMFNESEGTPVGTYSPGELGEITDPTTGKKSYGLVGGGWNPYTPPVTVPKDLPDSPQVNRADGSTFGGPLLDEKLPPGGGVRMGGALPPTPQVTPMRAAAPSPEADASLLGRFRTAMPSLNFAQPSGRGYQVAPLTEGDVAQQAMEQIAYPLRAAAAQEAKSGFQNPEEAAYLLEEKPKWRFRRAGATEMSEARKAGDILRQMYAE